jgi:hypothetical protein
MGIGIAARGIGIKIGSEGGGGSGGVRRPRWHTAAGADHEQGGLPSACGQGRCAQWVRRDLEAGAPEHLTQLEPKLRAAKPLTRGRKRPAYGLLHTLNDYYTLYTVSFVVTGVTVLLFCWLLRPLILSLIPDAHRVVVSVS